MKILGLIPARGGSKAIPGKNLVNLGGKPLLSWTCDAAKLSGLDRIIVSTDDSEIAEFARSMGIEIPFVRPSHISNDTAKTIDVVNHALDTLDDYFDAVMVLQPTSPFRSSSDIDRCILLLESSIADSVISVVNVGGHHPARMKYLDGNRLIDPSFCEEIENQSRQELRPMFLRNGAIYLTRTEVLRRKSFKGTYCLAHIMPAERSVNIDVPLDLIIANALLGGL